MRIVAVKLDDAQREALMQMHNGCILCGGVGSGKTRTALVYYHCIIGGGRVKPRFALMTHPVDLYVITTAATRDKFGWEGARVVEGWKMTGAELKGNRYEQPIFDL